MIIVKAISSDASARSDDCSVSFAHSGYVAARWAKAAFAARANFPVATTSLGGSQLRGQIQAVTDGSTEPFV